MGNTTKSTNNGITVTDGILIAVLSADAYLFGYAYQRGYNGYYNMPSVFSKVGLAEILTLGVLAIVYASIILTLALPLILVLYKGSLLATATRKRLFVAGYFLILAEVTFLTQGLYIPIWVIVGLGIAIIAIDFLYPLVRQCTLKKYSEKLESTATLYDGLYSFFDGARRILFFGKQGRLESSLIYLVLITSIGTALSFSYGNHSAQRKVNYLVANTSPEMVVLTMFDDYVVLSPFDRNTKELQPVFLVQKLDKSPSIVFALEPVGPLKPKQILAPTLVPSSALTPISTDTLTLVGTSTSTP